VREGRWLDEKLDERHELGGLVFVFWSSEMGRWETSGHGPLTQEVLSHFALRGLDPFSAYVYHVYRWPLHSGPWSDDCWVAHLREIDDARRRIDVLRPYFKRLRSRGIPAIKFDLPPKKDKAARPLPLFPVRKVRKWGYKNSEGQMVVDFAFSEAQPFSEDLAWVRREDRWIALTTEGKIGIELEVESVERVWPFVNGWARFRRGRMEQVYNYDGERPVLERIFVGYYNFVSREGKLMYPVASEEEFIRAENFRGPFAWVQTRNSERMWIDQEGQPASEGEIQQWRLENNDWSVAGSYLDGFRFVDAEGKVMLELPKGPGNVRPFHDGLAAMWVENKGTGYIDRKGQVVVPPQYAYGLDFSQGLAAVCPDSRVGLWTYIDVKGRPIAAPEFSEAQPFHGGLALVKKNLYYYLDQSGRLLLPPGM
jgi:hypothetical protein